MRTTCQNIGEPGELNGTTLSVCYFLFESCCWCQPLIKDLCVRLATLVWFTQMSGVFPYDQECRYVQSEQDLYLDSFILFCLFL